jgi:hypothetical protein
VYGSGVLTLGLDPSLRSYGWAIHDSSATGRARRVASGHEGTLSDVVPVARFLHFQALVEDLLRKFPEIEAVGIESPAYEAGPFQTIHFGLMMFSQIPIFERRKDLVLYDPTTLKYLAKEDPMKRKGFMGKADMQRKVQLDTMDVNVIDNNEADAYLIALYSARMMMLLNGTLKPEQLTPSEKSVFMTRERKMKRSGKTVKKKVSHIFREGSRYFKFSQIPQGSVKLPQKTAISSSLIKFLEELETS